MYLLEVLWKIIPPLFEFQNSILYTLHVEIKLNKTDSINFIIIFNRYDKEKNELVCEESGIAYPIVDGIPNLVPQDARIINKDTVDRNESPPKTQNK